MCGCGVRRLPQLRRLGPVTVVTRPLRQRMTAANGNGGQRKQTGKGFLTHDACLALVALDNKISDIFSHSQAGLDIILLDDLPSSNAAITAAPAAPSL